jgi:N-acetylneuraminic acid mutarotase
MKNAVTEFVIHWKEKQPLPEATAGAASAVVGHDLVVAGGTQWNGDSKRWLDCVNLYSFENGQWRNGPKLPKAFAYGCFAVTQAGLEIIGGCDSAGPYRDSWALQSVDSEWRRSEDAPQSFVFGAAENWSRHLHVFGGCASDRDPANAHGEVWIRNTNRVWHQISVLPRRNVLLSAHACAGDKVYLFGGYSVSPGGGVLNHDEAFSFDCNTHEWVSLRKLPLAARGSSAVALDNRWIVILGGYSTGFLKTVLFYDIARDRYEEGTPLPIGLLDTHFVLYKDEIYGAGGEDRARGRTSKCLAGYLDKFS